MGDNLLAHAGVYLLAAVIVVPVVSRLGLGSVLGYLLAGVALGPWGLDLVSEESTSVMHFAELGVVMMLFLIGLELDPKRLWRLRVSVFGLGGLQMVLTTLVVGGIAWAFGSPPSQALAVGLIVTMSSTAMALQVLGERGQLKTEGGQTAFAVLLLQDVAVIPILALLPLLATLPTPAGGASHRTVHWIDQLAAWQQALAVLGALLAVIVAGRLAVGPAMRAVARTGLRELFAAFALLIIVGVSLLMGVVGLSPALGAFMAGVVLANSEYRHELFSDIEPFKGLLLGLFFIAVGASIDFQVLTEAPVGIGVMVVGLMLLKICILAFVARVGGLSIEQGAITALSLAQVGEFAFVLLALAGDQGVLPEVVTKPLVAATAFTMALTTFWFVVHDRLVAPLLANRLQGPTPESDVVDESHPVLIAGYGRFGQIVGRLLSSQGIESTVLDVDLDQIARIKRFGLLGYYGDAARLDVLHAAGAHQAKVLVVAIDQPEKAQEIVELAQRHFPHLAILARARGRTAAYGLVRVGTDGVYRETLDSALRMGIDALRVLGTPAYAAHRAAVTFRDLDERLVREMAGLQPQDEAGYVTVAKTRLANLEALMAKERDSHHEPHTHDWEGDVLRETMLASTQGGLDPKR